MRWLRRERPTRVTRALIGASLLDAQRFADAAYRISLKHRWIAYAGLAIIFYVACQMIYRGAHELKPVINMASGLFE